MPFHPVKNNATNKDLQLSIERVLPIAAAQPEAKKLALQLRGATDMQTCRNIFDYVVRNIRYVKDGEHQIVKLPSAILRTRTGDCKSMTVLICSLLMNNGIRPKLVYASYRKENPTPTHVYCQTDTGIIMDAVWKRFNSEKTPAYKFVKPTKAMNISYLSGIGAAPKKGLLAKGAAVVKTAAAPLVIGRTMFLLIIRNNLDGIATKLSTGNRESQIATWKKAGGDGKALAEAIQKGAAKPAKKIGFLGKLKGRMLKKKVSGINGPETDDNALKSAITAISTALGATVGSAVPGAGTAAGGGAGVALGQVMVMVLPIVKEAVLKTAPADVVSETAPLSVPSENLVAPPEEKTVAPPPVEAPAPPAGSATPATTTPAVPAVTTPGAPLTNNKMLLYGAAALAAFLILKK